MKLKSPHEKEKKSLSLVRALTYIVISIFFISGTSHSILKNYFKWQKKKQSDPTFHIVSIVQTGPQKEALKTVYLAELMGISVDRPISIHYFNAEKAKKHLLGSPLIKEAEIQLVKPNILYVDYTVRQPLAWLYDYENTAVDEEGFLFPVSPFFSPKNLPEIYLGLASFGQHSTHSDRLSGSWNVPIKEKSFFLALDLLKLLSQPGYRELFKLRRIDVSNAYAESYGSREVVLIVEDEILIQEKGREQTFVFPRILRLSSKNYSQELGNFLKLRPQLLEQDRKVVTFSEKNLALVRMPEKIIDFRIPSLAYIK